MNRYLLIAIGFTALVLTNNSLFAYEWKQCSITGHYYSLTSSAKTWQNAEAEAQGLGGHLVTIRSQSENDWLKSNFTQSNLWIGLYQPSGSSEPAGGWTWISGENTSYRNWIAGEPSNSDAGENHAEINHAHFIGQWNDELGSTLQYGIIEVANTSGLVAYWKFNEGSGTIAADSSGNLHNGTICGAAWDYGILDKALKYDGINDYISFGNSGFPSYLWNGDFSVSLWIYPTSISSGDQYIIWFGTSDGMIYIKNSAVTFRFWDGSGHQVQTTSLSNNSWYHVVVTRSKIYGMKIFLNEELVDSNVYTANANSLAQDTRIGDRDNQGQYDFHGIIDEVRIYNRQLSASEITDLYNLVVPVVNNVTATQKDDGSKEVVIVYDLSNPNGENCAVSLQVSNDGGNTWTVPAYSLTGAIGSNICPGSGKRITWNAVTDAPGSFGDSYRIRVISTGSNSTGYALSGTFTIDNRFDFPVYDLEDNSLLGYVVWLSGSDADPVNTATGNFTHDETDLSITTRSEPLQFARFYNSKDTLNGPLGIGWTHSYNISLTTGAGSSGTLVAVRWGDGRTDYWDDLGGGVYEPNMPGLVDKLETIGTDWKLTKKNMNVYIFDSSGMLKTVTDKNGNVFTLNYNASQLVSVSDPAGRTLTLAYHPDGKLASITDFASPARTVQYQYTDGRLTQVTDPGGGTITYTYTPEGWLETITNQQGITTLYNFYDDQGRVTDQMDGNYNITNFAYVAENGLNKTIITYPDGTSNDHLHSANNLLLMIRYPHGSVHYAYDDQMNRTQIIDRNGNVTNFTYDLRGNVLQTMDPNDPNDINDGGITTLVYGDVRFPDFPTQKTEVLGRVTTWVYDVNGNCTKETDPNGFERTWTYNSFGQKLTETDKNGNTTTFTYSPEGKLKSVTDAMGHTTSFIYDQLWRPTQVTDALGRITLTTYDKFDRIVRVDKPLSTISYIYDRIGNVVRQTSPNGSATIFSYDNNKNLTSVTDALANVISYTYDSLNRKITFTDPDGNTTQYEYDSMGRLIKETDPNGNITTAAYDNQGNVISRTDGEGVTVLYEYDSLNRLVKQGDELGNNQRWEYDKAGQVTKTIDARGNISSYSYDPLGRLVSVTDPLGNSTLYAYDRVGNVKIVVDTGNRTIFMKNYDAVGRLIEKIDGNGNSSTYDYDAVGNLISKTDENGSTTSYTYDEENRLIAKTPQSGGPSSYTYDDNGNMLTAINSEGTTSFVYDALDRLVSSTDSFGKTVQYAYDKRGNCTAITYPADSVNPARTVNYTYDNANRLDKITDWSGRIWDYTFDRAGRITQLTYPNGVKKKQTFDAAARLTELVYTNSSDAEILAYRYTRDALGNPISANETGTLMPDVTTLAKKLIMNFDADNRLTSSNEAVYSYDNIGNVTGINKGVQLTTFAYNNENSLVSQVSEGHTIEHKYNALNDRIAKIADGNVTRYVLSYGGSMSHVLCETDSSGNIIAYYIHGPEVVGRIDAGSAQRFYHTDAVGSVAALTDDTQAITDKYAYTPFGELAGRTGTTANPFTYVGGYGVMTEVDNLYFMRARFYDPQTGRFLGKDPVEGTLQQPMSLHRYYYVYNNPLIQIDYNGREPITLAVITAFVAIPAIVRGSGDAALYTWEHRGHDDFNWGWGSDEEGGLARSFTAGAAGGVATGAGALLGPIGAVGGSLIGTYAHNSIEDGRRNSLQDVKEDIFDYVTSAVLAGWSPAKGSGTKQITKVSTAFFGSRGKAMWINSAIKNGIKFGIQNSGMNIPALYDDPKLNVYYVNGKAKSLGGGGQ
ncbi:MAG: hypothetical protein GYA34_18355 [Chloroflexi bacterium]|nr:hypothetical protein [Chloroflexota bacterium]